MSFQWDPRKAKANLKKHGVSFEQASTVFLDPGLRLLPDPEHSVVEERIFAIGASRRIRALVVSYCYRGDIVRIISARRATPGEVKQHFGG